MIALAAAQLGCAAKVDDDDDDDTSSTTGDGADGTSATETTGAPACEPPEWFACRGTDICTQLDCASPYGRLDEHGCERSWCTSTADCAGGEQCIDTVIANSCEASGSFCDVATGECSCGGTNDCMSQTRCVDQGAAATACVTEGADCNTLFAWSESLANAFGGHLQAGHEELRASVADCSVTVEQAILDQPGQCASSLCGEVCRLHFCAEHVDCEARCERAATAISEDQLREIVLTAAAAPGLCTCDPCTAETFGFCQAVWDCQGG